MSNQQSGDPDTASANRQDEAGTSSSISRRRLSSAIDDEFFRLQPDGPGRIAVRVREVVELVPPIAKSWAVPILVLTVGVLGLFAPVPLWLEALTTEQSARDFLGQMWQVSGAAVGLSIAVVVFAFQGISSGGPSSALRDSGVATPLLAVVYLGVTALVVDALVLLEVGDGAPARWAASWATFVSGAALVSVAFLFAAALRTVDPELLHRRRIDAIDKQAAEVVNRDVRLRIGLILLQQAEASMPVSFSPIGRPSSIDEEVVAATRKGVVKDVNLSRLSKLASRLASEGAPKPQLYAYPDREVREGSPLLGITSSDPKLKRLAESIVKVRTKRRAPVDLTRHVEQIHDEAVQAIANSSVSGYKQAQEVQERMLLAFPDAWARFGATFDVNLAGGIFPLNLGPVDRIRRNVYEQLVSAVGRDQREIALSAGYTPFAVCHRATEIAATGLTSQMLGLVRSFAVIAGESAVAELTREHSVLNLTHYATFEVGPRVEDERADDDMRWQSVELLGQCFDAMAEISKSSIESRDVKTFTELARSWHRVLEFWLDEHAAFYAPESIAKQLAVEVRNERTRMQFSVLVWLLHRLWQAPEDNDLRTMLSTARKPYSVADDVLRAAELVRGYERRSKISDWVSADLPSGEVHWIDSDTPTLRAVAALLAASSTPTTAPIRPSTWLRDKHADLKAQLEQIRANDDFLGSVSATHVQGDIYDGLIAAIDDAVSKQKADDVERLINTPIRAEARKQFREAVTTAWHENRSALALLISAGVVVETDVGVVPVVRLGLKPRFENKIWVSDDSHDFGLSQIGQQNGRALANGESKAIFDALAGSELVADWLAGTSVPQAPLVCDSLSTQLRGCIDAMKAEGYEPSLVVIGSSWQLQSSLDIEALPDTRDLDPRVHGVLGQFDGVLVAQSHRLKDHDLAIVDVRAWCTVAEWTSAVGGGLQAELTEYDEEAARQLLENQPELFKEQTSTQAQKVSLIRRRMRVDVSVAVAFKLQDPRAAMRLEWSV